MGGKKSSNRMTLAQYRGLKGSRLGIVREKPIERAILQYLQLIGITAWKQNNGAFKVEGRFIRVFMDADGNGIVVLDIAGWMPDGRALHIEVKRPGENPTEDQRAFLENAKKSGCVAFVARSVDDVISNLKKFNS